MELNELIFEVYAKRKGVHPYSTIRNGLLQRYEGQGLAVACYRDCPSIITENSGSIDNHILPLYNYALSLCESDCSFSEASAWLVDAKKSVSSKYVGQCLALSRDMNDICDYLNITPVDYIYTCLRIADKNGRREVSDAFSAALKECPVVAIEPYINTKLVWRFVEEYNTIDAANALSKLTQAIHKATLHTGILEPDRIRLCLTLIFRCLMKYNSAFLIMTDAKVTEFRNVFYSNSDTEIYNWFKGNLITWATFGKFTLFNKVADMLCDFATVAGLAVKSPSNILLTFDSDGRQKALGISYGGDTCILYKHDNQNEWTSVSGFVAHNLMVMYMCDLVTNATCSADTDIAINAAKSCDDWFSTKEYKHCGEIDYIWTDDVTVCRFGADYGARLILRNVNGELQYFEIGPESRCSCPDEEELLLLLGDNREESIKSWITNNAKVELHQETVDAVIHMLYCAGFMK